MTVAAEHYLQYQSDGPWTMTEEQAPRTSVDQINTVFGAEQQEAQSLLTGKLCLTIVEEFL